MDNESSSGSKCNLQPCSTQDDKYDYKDVPDLITNVKQEILDEEVPQDANKDFKLECEQEYGGTQFILLDYGKANINEKVKTYASGKMTGKKATSNDGKPKGLFKLNNVQKVIAHLKNSLKKNEETLDSRKESLENLRTNKNSSFVKKYYDNSTDCVQGSSGGTPICVKVEEVIIKSENEEEDDSMSSKHIAEKQQGNSMVYKCRHCPSQTDHLDQSGEGGTFKCEQCNFQTMYKDCFTMHMEWHQKLENMNLFKCLQCTYQTCRRSNLERHVLTHQNYRDDMLKCNECDYQAVSSRHLVIHLRWHNTKKSTLKCYHCDFTATCKATLISHLAKHQSYENTDEFKCHQCDYRTLNKKNLYKHCLRHKNPKTTHFKCDYCNYITIQKASLNKHLLQHKVFPDTRIFRCDKCYYQTSRKDALNIHRLRHKNSDNVNQFKFRCAHCDFQTIHRRNITKHVLVHKNPEQTKFLKSSDNFKCILVRYRKM